MKQLNLYAYLNYAQVRQMRIAALDTLTIKAKYRKSEFNRKESDRKLQSLKSEIVLIRRD